MTISVMIDLETWGTTPGSDIRSIGACVFDPATGHVAQPDHAYIGTPGWFYFACDNPVIAEHEWSNPKHLGGGTKILPEYKYPLHRDPRTAQWWSEQSDEAQTAFDNPVDLREALDRFDHWLQSVAGRGNYSPANQHVLNIRIWSHGASFDPPILAAAYEAVGLPIPWHYRAPRDTRTAFDMAGIDDHSTWLKQHPGPLGIAHHALDDSICQARAVCAAYARLTV